MTTRNTIPKMPPRIHEFEARREQYYAKTVVFLTVVFCLLYLFACGLDYVIKETP